MKTEDCFYLGYITRTKGLKGEVQIFFEFDDYEDLALESVLIEINNKLIPFFIASYKLHSNKTGYFYLEDIDTIEKAEKLLRKKLYQPLDQKPVRSDDEFYYTDLKGFIVYDEKFGELGEIIEVHEYPQQFVAVVPYKFREVLFPLNEDIIQSIDQDAGTVNVILPDGLVDLYIGG